MIETWADRHESSMIGTNENDQEPTATCGMTAAIGLPASADDSPIAPTRISLIKTESGTRPTIA